MIPEVGIFVVGLLVTSATLIAVVLIGVSEAHDPAHSRAQDLSEFERRVTGREQPATVEE